MNGRETKCNDDADNEHIFCIINLNFYYFILRCGNTFSPIIIYYNFLKAYLSENDKSSIINGSQL